MRLQRIYSSKVYVTSTRKDKIHAAINDPINVELVRQLSDYLDDEGKIELKQALGAEKRAEQSSGSDSGAGASGGSSSGGSSPAPMSSGHSFTGDLMSDFGDDELADVEPMEDPEADALEPIAEEPAAEPTEAEAATVVEGQPITATTVTVWTAADDISAKSETIKGTLNSREDTKGVNRLQVKDDELWIYFNDDENLNDKMISVIETLNSVGYTCLAFSRLARSNNAIVFDINYVTVEPIKTVVEVEEAINNAK